MLWIAQEKNPSLNSSFLFASTNIKVKQVEIFLFTTFLKEEKNSIINSKNKWEVPPGVAEGEIYLVIIL